MTLLFESNFLKTRRSSGSSWRGRFIGRFLFGDGREEARFLLYMLIDAITELVTLTKCLARIEITMIDVNRREMESTSKGRIDLDR